VSIEIFVRNRDVDGALRLLKRRMMREGVLRILRDHAEYTKPSVKCKRKIARAEVRRHKVLKRWKRKLEGDAR